MALLYWSRRGWSTNIPSGVFICTVGAKLNSLSTIVPRRLQLGSLEPRKTRQFTQDSIVLTAKERIFQLNLLCDCLPGGLICHTSGQGGSQVDRNTSQNAHPRSSRLFPSQIDTICQNRSAGRAGRHSHRQDSLAEPVSRMKPAPAPDPTRASEVKQNMDPPLFVHHSLEESLCFHDEAVTRSCSVTWV